MPNLVVIGSSKCGTTALHAYLDLHPETSMSRPKELDFFIDRPEIDRLPPEERRLTSRTRTNWWRGLDWYAGHFSPAAAVRGESSPRYSAPWFPGTAGRMASVVPDAKLIFMVRDPIERAVSHYIMRRAAGHEPRSVDAALGNPASTYVVQSRYSTALAPFLSHFPRSRLLVIDQDDLRRRRRETLRAVFDFAGVEGSFWSTRFDREWNPSVSIGRRRRVMFKLRRMRIMRPALRLPAEVKWAVERLASDPPRERPELSPAVRAGLAAELASEVAGLRELTGRKFGGWTL